MTARAAAAAAKAKAAKMWWTFGVKRCGLCPRPSTQVRSLQHTHTQDDSRRFCMYGEK